VRPLVPRLRLGAMIEMATLDAKVKEVEVALERVASNKI
jgi:hypothetical protein